MTVRDEVSIAGVAWPVYKLLALAIGLLVLVIVAVATSFLAIWLTAGRRMLCWPINLLACGLYFKLFLDVRLYADMVLQALFGVGILYGWIAWARGCL